jgi:hypothetical protein
MQPLQERILSEAAMTANKYMPSLYRPRWSTQSGFKNIKRRHRQMGHVLGIEKMKGLKRRRKEGQWQVATESHNDKRLESLDSDSF